MKNNIYRSLILMVLSILLLTSCMSAIVSRSVQADKALEKKDIVTLGELAVSGNIKAVRNLQYFPNNKYVTEYLARIIKDRLYPHLKREALHSLSFQIDQELARQIILEQLTSQKSTLPIRSAIINSLRISGKRLKNKQYAQDLLVTGLNDANPSIRLETAISLRKLGNYKYSKIVFELLHEDYVVIRRKAVEEIIHYTKSSYIEKLKELSSDNDPTIRGYAKKAITRYYKDRENRIASSQETPVSYLASSKKLATYFSKNKTALVIGNNNYINSPLKNPVNDATDMKNTLKKLNFDVIFKTNVNQREMDAVLNQFRTKLKSDGGMGFFYYAGHGMQVKGKNYLIPIDAKIEKEVDIRHQAIPVGKILDYMDDADSQLNVVVLDACRNNPISRSYRSAKRGLARIQQMPDSDLGYIVAFATESGGTASDGKGRNSPFTQHLIQSLNIPNMSLSDVFRQTRIGVYSDTEGNQRPLLMDGTLADISLN